MMEDKIKQLLEWLEISEEKADKLSDKYQEEGKLGGFTQFGKACAFSDCKLKVKEIFET